MDGRLDATGEALRSPIPWVIVTATIALTAAAWFVIDRGRHEEARQQFERRTETAAAALRARTLTYEQVVRAGAARIASDPQVTATGWRQFIGHQQLDERFPGIRSIGYAQVTNAKDDAAAVLYVEPASAPHAVAVGEDLNADPVRRAALARARATGEPVITGRVQLAGAGTAAPSPGFLMFVPVFPAGSADGPLRERAGAAAGYVFGAFRMRELLQGILDQGVLQVIDMRIYDHAEGRAPQAELIDTRTAGRATPATRAPMLERVTHYRMPGRTWTIQFVSRPEFDAALRDDRPWVVLAGGALGSVVMFLLTTALVEAWNRAHHLSMRDPLTGLYNRRYLDETMAREVARAKRAGQEVGVIAVDIDHFKRLNDSHGHDMGDLVLQRVGELLRTAARAGDIACRMGGEEFALILPGATTEAARDRAESIRSAFSALRFDYEGREVGPFTLSAGVSSLPPEAQDWAYALRQADRALYAAKQVGRNRVLSAAEA
jgi:diguanylate cyclase (GGDEF)-like protein